VVNGKVDAEDQKVENAEGLTSEPPDDRAVADDEPSAVSSGDSLSVSSTGRSRTDRKMKRALTTHKDPITSIDDRRPMTDAGWRVVLWR